MDDHLVPTLNEMCAARCIFGDRHLALIPVSCLGGHLFPAHGLIPKAESIPPSSSSSCSRYLIVHSTTTTHHGRKGHTTDGDGEGDGYLDEVCRKVRIWKMDLDAD
jgi:hypothetical protein